MRGHGEDAVAQFALEAVHDRQHHDQRRDPERQAAHRHQRHERDEAAPVRRAQVAACRSATRTELIAHS